MNITYTKKASGAFEGKDWIMYSDINHKTTNVFRELREGIEKLKEVPFKELYPKIRELYKNKFSRSNCYLMEFGSRKNIELSRPNKCLPTIWICCK